MSWVGAGSMLAAVACANASHDDAASAQDAATASVAEPSPVRAVIVKTAGYLPEEGPSDRPDAITRATTANYNSHIYADRLAELLLARGIEAEVFEHLDCPELDCALESDDRAAASIVVVAAKTEYLQVVPEGRALVPHLAAMRPMPEVVAVVTSFGSADTALETFEDMLEDEGLTVVAGTALGPAQGMDDARMEQGLADLADRLAQGPVGMSL
jgi:hypothetical protein